jgi:hypothetical protein
MIREILLLACLVLALVAALFGCSAKDSERLLWGSLACSLGLACGAGVLGSGFYGFLFLASFLATDLVVYLFFRTLKLLPGEPPKNLRVDKSYRVFFLWLILVLVSFSALVLWFSNNELFSFPGDLPASGFAVLESRAWAQDWLLLAVPASALVGLVMGGFFLVRRRDAQ